MNGKPVAIVRTYGYEIPFRLEWLASEAIDYIERRKERFGVGHIHYYTTVRQLARRLKIRQADVKRVIDQDPRLCLSSFAFAPIEPSDSFGEGLTKAWFPRWRPDAPLGQKHVFVLDTDEQTGKENRS